MRKNMIVQQVDRELCRLLQEGEIQKVEPCLLSMRKQAADEEDPVSYIRIGRELLAFYRETGEYEKAFAAVEDLLLLMEELGLSDSASFADILIEGGTTYGAAGQYGQARRCYAQAVNLCERIKGGKEENATVEYTVALTGLGETCYHTENYAEALSFYEKALDSVKASGMEGKADAAAVLCENCAAACDRLQRREAAEQYRSRAARIRNGDKS